MVNIKFLTLKLDGSIPEDNPFIKGKVITSNNDSKNQNSKETLKARPEIWSFGHRSPQGLARHPETGDLWLSEMGPRGGDELNLIKKSANYGWPEVTYGKEN